MSSELFKLFIGTPMSGGMATGVYTNSMVQLASFLGANAIPCGHGFVYANCYVADARNMIVEKFLATDCSHLMFIDADMGFDPNFIIQLVKAGHEKNCDIIGADYPKRVFRWDLVQKAIEGGAPADMLPFCTSERTARWKDMDKIEEDMLEPQEAEFLGTGFMMIRRRAFEIFRHRYPERVFGEGKRCLYFQAEVMDDEYVSDDVYFCKMMRAAGVSVWGCPWIQLTHVGQYNFGAQAVTVAL